VRYTATDRKQEAANGDISAKLPKDAADHELSTTVCNTDRFAQSWC